MIPIIIELANGLAVINRSKKKKNVKSSTEVISTTRVEDDMLIDDTDFVSEITKCPSEIQKELPFVGFNGLVEVMCNRI